MKYTIVLVDDEDEVRGRIASKIEGQKDFEVIGSASNGYDALDLLEEHTPDVVITDIKMPFVDGIELTRIIRKSYPTVKVAIISGYDDYSYLKEAINLDVVAYLSKPITSGNVEEFLDKIKQSLDAENEHIQLKEEMVLNQVRNRIIYHYLNEYQLNNDDEIMVNEVGISISQPHVVICTRLMNFTGNIIELEKKKNQCFLMMEELVGESFNAYHILFGQDIVSIVKADREDFKKTLDLVLYKVINDIKKYILVDIAMGVSLADQFDNLFDLYRQCQFELESYGMDDSNTINYYGDNDIIPDKKSFNVEDINEFKKNMRYMNDEDFSEYIAKLTKKIKEEHLYDFFCVIVTLSGLLIEYSDSVSANLRRSLDINTIKTYIESKNIDGFMILITKLTSEMKADIATRKTKKTSKLMGEIIAYLEQHYDNPEMNMDMVGDAFNISVSYLSTLFKKETETTFNRYLVSKRIDHAKLLLKNTEDKMVSIAEKCGYKDVYYFSHSFKKTTGQSPKEFKKNEAY
ncbi:response regulator transcription factor [Petrocella sp. FN5]|uniref:response regulator transcription factor n=1 Tax=Petrocella sp. FN5 TaxID=3032002 RepID=UPI0023DB5E39|nr:response regulator [Petrocella sp. FN5]MDF1618536.1 response regulator [Petrocella sp. FN5]